MPRFFSQRRGMAPLLIFCSFIVSLCGVGTEASRLKDIVSFQGIRSNQLIGYGLVVGLNGSGDSSSPVTIESLKSMMQRMGVNVRDKALSTKNVAAVIVSANLPPFAKPGTTIDIHLSSIGDAKSLQGGFLLVTPLLAADGQVYAVAQGAVVAGGFSAAAGGGGGANQGQQSITRGVPTSGYIANGATVEKEIDFNINTLSKISISLNNPDITTSRRVAEAINAHMNLAIATTTSPATVEVIVPERYKNNTIGLLGVIEQVPITPDQPAKIVISEDTGVIVMGEKVRISNVAVAQGNLTVKVTETPQVSQPGAFAEAGNTEVINQANVEVEESNARMKVLEGGASLHDLVQSLNGLGVGPRDVISILQSIKAAGALQANIEVI